MAFIYIYIYRERVFSLVPCYQTTILEDADVCVWVLDGCQSQKDFYLQHLGTASYYLGDLSLSVWSSCQNRQMAITVRIDVNLCEGQKPEVGLKGRRHVLHSKTLSRIHAVRERGVGREMSQGVRMASVREKTAWSHNNQKPDDDQRSITIFGSCWEFHQTLVIPKRIHTPEKCFQTLAFYVLLTWIRFFFFCLFPFPPSVFSFLLLFFVRLLKCLL